MHFVEDHYAGDPTNGWLPNRACAEAMLRSAGFRVVAHPETEVFLCRPEERSERHTSGAVYPARSAMSVRSVANTGGVR